jgi:ATP-dependent DNA helicase DinG
VQFLGTTLATGQAIELGRDLLGAGLQHARGLQPWAELQAGVERAARELRLACAGPQFQGREVRGIVKRRWEEVADELPAALSGLAHAAGLAAEGETVISGVHHIDRGYDDLVGRLAAVGAPISRR